MGRLAKDSIVVSVIIMLGFVIGTISTMFIYPRICSKEDLGIFRYLLNWGTLFGQLCTLGIGTAAVRTFYRFKESSNIGALSSFLITIPLLGLALFSVFFVFFSGWFLSATTTDNSLPEQSGLIVTGLVIFTIAMTYTRTYAPIGNVLQKTPAIFFVSELLTRFTVLAVLLLYYAEVLNFTTFIIGLSVCYVVQLFAVLFIIRDYFVMYPFVMPKRELVKPTIKLSLFCLIDSGAGMLVTQIDLIMIGAMCLNSFARIQEYSMALSIASMVYLPWRSIINTTIPFIAEAMQKNDMPALERIYQKSSLNLFLTGCVIFTLIFPNMDNLISMIEGDYTVIKYPVLFLCISKLVDMLGSVNNSIINLSPFYRYNFYFNMVLVGIIFLTNWLLIPPFGLTGSGIATAICLLLFNLMKGVMIYRKYGIHPLHQKTADVILFMGLILAIGLVIPNVIEQHSFLDAFINITVRDSILFLLIVAYFIWRKPSEEMEKIRVNIFKRIPVLKRTVK